MRPELAKGVAGVAYAIVRGETYGSVLAAELGRCFSVDAGSALNDCPLDGQEWSSVVAGAEPLTTERIRFCMAVAPQHPAMRAFAKVGSTEPVRISDLVRLRSFWGTPPYAAMHGTENGRFPMGMVLATTPERIMFVGLQRVRHDFTDAEMTELAQVQAIVVAALRLRCQLDELVEDASGAPTRSRPGEDAGVESDAYRPTRREAEVLGLARLGWTNRRIATALDVSERTVRKHLSAVYRKGRFSGRAETVAWWQRQSL